MISRQSRAFPFAPTFAASLLLALAAACGGSDTQPATGGTSSTGTGGGGTTSSSSSSTSSSTSSSSTSSGSSSSGSSSGGPTCVRTPGPADGPRKLVIAHPFDAANAKSNAWEVLDLDAAGNLSQPGVTFEMGRGFTGEVVFTPDGKVGIVVQEDGSLGVLAFDDAGQVSVVHAGFKGSFYAGSVVINPDGAGAWVLDPNWPGANGGGLYRVDIGCDGKLTDKGLVLPSKLAYGMVRLGATPTRAVVAATEVGSSTAGDYAHLLDLGGATPSLVGSAPAFPDADAIISSIARTHDDKLVFIGDNQEFAATPNRIAVVSVSSTGVSSAAPLSPILDPMAIVISPDDDAGIVVSGYGNAVYKLSNPKTAPALGGQITYNGAKPQLPANAVQIERGALRGRVFVAELMGVRQIRFPGGGAVTDLGLFTVGADSQNMVGAIGVQP